jgi:uncharacterized protein YfaP (DUF2135 family)
LEGERELQLTIGGVSTRNQTSTTVSQTVTTKQVGSGSLQISLSWNNDDDLDLWVYVPSGERIFYGNRQVGNGELDLDALPCSSANKVRNENVYFTGQLANGEYRVVVNLFGRCSSSNGIGATYSVGAYTNGQSFTFSAGSQHGKFSDGTSSGTSAEIGTITVSNGAVVR